MNKRNFIDMPKGEIALSIPGSEKPELVAQIQDVANDFAETHGQLDFNDPQHFMVLRDYLGKKFGIPKEEQGTSPRYKDTAWLGTMIEVYKMLANIFGQTPFYHDISPFMGIGTGTLQRWRLESNKRGRLMQDWYEYCDNIAAHKTIGSRTTAPNVGAIYVSKAFYGHMDTQPPQMNVLVSGVTDMDTLIEKYGKQKELPKDNEDHTD